MERKDTEKKLDHLITYLEKGDHKSITGVDYEINELKQDLQNCNEDTLTQDNYRRKEIFTFIRLVAEMAGIKEIKFLNHKIYIDTGKDIKTISNNGYSGLDQTSFITVAWSTLIAGYSKIEDKIIAYYHQEINYGKLKIYIGIGAIRYEL